MPRTTHRRLSPSVAAAVVATVATAPVLLTATAAYADPGTIKVHAQGTPFDENANNPKPGCSFYIAAFGVTAGETYRVTFEPQPANGSGPAGDPTTASDTYKATMNISKNGKKGDGRTRLFNPDPDNPEIANGQYKVTAANVNDPGDRKTKVFRVDCPAPGSTPTPTPTPGGNSGGEGGEDNPGDVGGVGNPDSDNGSPGVGGVATGGGGLAAATPTTDVTGPLLLTGAAASWLLLGPLLRRRVD